MTASTRPAALSISLVAACLLAAAVSCKGSDSPAPAAEAPDAQAAIDGPPNLPPSVGAAACLSEEACRSQCQEEVDRLAGPEPSWARRFPLSECVKRNYGGTAAMPAPGPTPPGCECGGPSGGAQLQPGLGQDCLLRGRAQQCLYTEAEFPGCSVAEASTSCRAACDEVERRLALDAQTPIAATVQATHCSPGQCACVLNIGGLCRLRSSPVAYDCALSALEISAREAARLNPPPSETANPHPGDQRQICEQSSHCGLSLACLAGHCGACTADRDCASGEGCALGQCLRLPFIGCRANAECKTVAPDAVCLTNGGTGGYPRGNEATVSRCQPLSGGRPRSMGGSFSFTWTDSWGPCSGAACQQRLEVNVGGQRTVTFQDRDRRFQGTLTEADERELGSFLTDPQATWVLELPSECPRGVDRDESVQIVDGDRLLSRDITGCQGPPYDQLRRWVDRLIAPLTGAGVRGCSPGADQTCNDDPRISALWGTCLPDRTCQCRPGFVTNAASGRCTPAP